MKGVLLSEVDPFMEPPLTQRGSVLPHSEEGTCYSVGVKNSKDCYADGYQKVEDEIYLDACDDQRFLDLGEKRNRRAIMRAEVHMESLIND